MSREIQNLCLGGFMGTGKSTIGRLVAEQLRFEFVDTDEWIEAESGQTVTQIFERQGEAAFRAWEKRAVAEMETKKGAVIATGGGLAANPDNLASLKKHSLVVCLWASPETVFERVKDQTHRPLLQSPDPLQKIRDLLATRMPAYRQADVLVSTENRLPREIAFLIAQQFRASIPAAP
jgi:shikimate kinase